ncbi:Gamma-glutamyltranspeptidase precursor [Maioricimonas rarisocia]|uniref:Gamma-glutamyltranspeptidase n=1 Tax=Maioricimonas rarisocia TaxID=2528026 RepID=A0A517ZDQ9_9PLAN|nr:gamma-glutamyltransferase [Maioricimonas rarisocia]QDU40616.1 Gamma-glutamyltranspeptidase precursor [Maioricimonas rarisocia]
MSRLLNAVTLLTVLASPAAPLYAQQVAGPDEPYARGIVVADHPLASEAGAEVLRRGGNVVDAAVATAFALSVVRPESCGLGGGGFMVIWNAERQEAVAIDYREQAPRHASRDMYIKERDGKPLPADASRKGGLAAGVPGEVAGLCYALETYGSLDRSVVMQPAIRLAREGVDVDAQMRSAQRRTLAALAQRKNGMQQFAPLVRHYLNGGTQWNEGDRFHSPLAHLLERIAEQGRDAFYRGPVAEALVAANQSQGGILTLEDLATMEPRIRQPLEARFSGMKVISMPPPSSGGIALIQTLNTLSAWEAKHPDQRLELLGHNTVESVQLLTEALKHAFADRARFLGDTDFAEVPVDKLISNEYAATIASKIQLDQTHPADFYGTTAAHRDAGTSHFCVIDAAGNAVACTETINTTYGSYVVEPKYGVIFNNEMDDFTARPGEPNVFGLMQSEANAIAPGKKPLSSMSPTIVVEDGKAVMAAGASGGPRIITATLQVLLNMTRFGMSPSEAVSAPRVHHQWMPDELLIERAIRSKVGPRLEKIGHEVKSSSGLAASQAASRSEDGLRGGSDPRKGGQPAGW